SERLGEAGINPSVGNTGSAYDNALAETINGLYKTEVSHNRGPWQTKASVELATLEWVAWFNHQRLLESIGDIPPAEAEERYYRQLAAPAAEPALLYPHSPRDCRGDAYCSGYTVCAEPRVSSTRLRAHVHQAPLRILVPPRGVNVAHDCA